MEVISKIDEYLNKTLRNYLGYSETYHSELDLDSWPKGSLILISNDENYSTLSYLDNDENDEIRKEFEEEIMKILKSELVIKDDVAVDYDMGSITFRFEFVYAI